MKVEFIKGAKVNGVSYKKGDTLNVSSSIYSRLVSDEKSAKDFEPPKEEKKGK